MLTQNMLETKGGNNVLILLSHAKNLGRVMS